MFLEGIGKCFSAITDVVKAPFKLAGGLVQAGCGAIAMPFNLVGGLFGGGGSPAACQGAQMGVSSFM